MKNTIIFKSSSLNDIAMVQPKGYWEHTKKAAKAKIGDGVIIVPTKAALKTEERAIAMLGVISEILDGKDDNNWENDQSYVVRYKLDHIAMVPFASVESLMPVGQSASSIRYI